MASRHVPLSSHIYLIFFEPDNSFFLPLSYTVHWFPFYMKYFVKKHLIINLCTLRKKQGLIAALTTSFPKRIMLICKDQ